MPVGEPFGGLRPFSWFSGWGSASLKGETRAPPSEGSRSSGGDKVSNLREPGSDGRGSVTFPFAVQTQLKKNGGGGRIPKCDASALPKHSRTLHVRELLTEADCFPAHLAQHCELLLPSLPAPKPNFEIKSELSSPSIPG